MMECGKEGTVMSHVWIHLGINWFKTWDITVV